MTPEQVSVKLKMSGFSMSLTSDDRLQISPATKLSDDDRSLIVANKTGLIDWLKKAANESSMVAPLVNQRGHQGAFNWSDSEIESFNRRVVQFQNQSIDLPKAEAIAETLLVRDRDTDDRRMCVECLSLAKFNCTTPKAAGLTTRDVRPIRFMLQRCDGFKGRI